MDTQDTSKAIQALKDARPPATDRFTYLTIIETHLQPAILPALNEILQDAELTQEIGWDLVSSLVNLPESAACLETIARLGNPREVILKVLETLDVLNQDDGYQTDDEDNKPDAPSVSFTNKYITLLGMLAILHKRIKTKYPSRFLAETLQTVYRSYRPNQDMTASVINLVHSLSGKKRPPLPNRKSSVNVANPDLHGDASKNAPDPEADNDREDPDETALQDQMLVSFATCILESYVNGNGMAWAARLLEFYNPEKIVPGKKTMMAAFREDQELLARDAIVGQLVALIRDLGFSSYSKAFLKQLCNSPISDDPLSTCKDASSPDDIVLSTGGLICLMAYSIFSSAVFDADQPTPEMQLFPEHYALIERFVQDDAETQIQASPGTVEALVTIGLWLQSNNMVSAVPISPFTKPAPSSEEPSDEPSSEYMKYLHLVTLLAVYHPQIYVRNAATTLAGQVLHADPSDQDRLRILYDLLENCIFASLKACAITWLREEIIAASGPSTPNSVFADTQALETIQYVVFPNLASLRDSPVPELIEYFASNSPFLLQAANLGLFLWGSDNWKLVVPPNLEATVRERWLQPLQGALSALDLATKSGEVATEEGDSGLGPFQFDMDVLRERLGSLSATEAFKAAEEAERA